jgi:competence protein ComEC
MKILQFPLSKITIAFVIGILLFKSSPIQPLFLWLIIASSLSCLLLIHWHILKVNQSKFFFGISVLLTTILLGYATALIHKESRRNNHYTHLIKDNNDHALVLLVQEKIKNTAKNIRYTCEVLNLDSHNCTGKVILNIRKRNTANFNIGTTLVVKGDLYKNQSIANPNVFNYGKYLENQEIYAQVYTQNKQIKIIGYQSSIWASFSNFRNKIIANLQHSGINKKELYVLNALVLGQQQDISPEIVKEYQYAGAIHVLSVSGLHVGFIMLFLTFLLKPIPNSRKGAFIKAIIIIISLWIFAIIASLSPSIVRSVTMFSFLTIGLYLRRTVAVYHTLIVSILLILQFKPSFLFDVGFQLSYLALFFILWLQPLLSQIGKTKYKITSYCWDIVTVSFAAQIGTMPLSLYYFHQFPGLFFVTNLLILPLIGVIMAVGVLVVVIALFKTLPFCLAKAVELLIALLNNIIHYIATQEEFVIKNIAFSKEMLWGSYLLIILLVLWLKKPNYPKLILALSSVVALQLIIIHQKYTTANSTEFIVFNSRKNTLLTERIGNKVTVYSNDSILKTIDNNNILQPYLTGNFCQWINRKPIQNLTYFKQQKILLIDNTALYPITSTADIVILTQSPKLNLERFVKRYKPKQIIADGSNFKSYVKRWKATCLNEKIPFHYTNEKGFYKL